jgi:alcohol dehydrogenase class IV
MATVGELAYKAVKWRTAHLWKAATLTTTAIFANAESEYVQNTAFVAGGACGSTTTIAHGLAHALGRVTTAVSAS